MADDFAELALGDEQSGANPTFDVIAVTPALHVAANGFDDGESRLNHVGAAQRPAKLIRHAQFVNSERFFHAFFQATRGARIQIHQLAMQATQGPLGFGVVGHGVSILQFSSDIGLVFVG